MERLLIAAAVVVIALVIAKLAQRSRPDAPVRTGRSVPEQLNRADFAGPTHEWLVAVFTEATCATCGKAIDVAAALDSDAVKVHIVELSENRELHDRYAIDAVPTTVVADSAGVVRASFLGPPRAADLWAAVADLRD